jgi:DtxR family Mn-dependent transcriptional regulator
MLSPEEVDKLDADLGYPAFDPHGDPIPTADGLLEIVESQPLTDWPTEKPAQIVHIEDEPPQVFAQILAEGLMPGMILSVLESTPSRIVLEANEAEHVLAPVVAANISVREAPQTVPTPVFEKLTALKMGQQARVTGLDDACQGLTRRRFLDLGITPGVLIEPVLQSGFGEPTAYRVRDSLIALRREQSDLILIDRNGDKR